MIVAEPQLESAPKLTCLFHNIVAAVDFSAISKHALRYAIALASGSDAHLSVIHVLRADWRYEMLVSPPETDLEQIDAEQQLKTLIGDLRTNSKLDALLLRHGPICDAILTFAVQCSADLLILGTHGRGGLSKLSLGSVAEEILRRAACPVLTVGPGIPEELPVENFRTVLFATDFGPASAKALPLAISLAESAKARLVMLHMIVPVPATSSSLAAYAPATSAADELDAWEDSSRKRALRELRDCLPKDLHLARDPEFVVGTDFLAEGVLTAAERFHADLIVMGASHSAVPRLAAHSPWSAIHEVVAHAPCPVLTVAG